MQTHPDTQTDRPRRKQRLVAVAVATVCALFLTAFAALEPAAGEEAGPATELDAVQTRAATDPAGAAQSLQSILDGIGSAWAKGISNFLGGLQAFDAQWWSVWGKLFIGGIVMLIRGIMCAFGEWLCKLAPMPTF